MGVGHRYPGGGRGIARKKRQSRMSRKAVMRLSTRAPLDSLIPGKRYEAAKTRLSDGNAKVTVYGYVCDPCIPWNHQCTLEQGCWTYKRTDGEDSKRQEARVSVVKDSAHAASIIFDRLPEFEAIVMSTLLDAEGIIDTAIGASSMDFKRIIDMVHDRIWTYSESSNESLESLLEKGINLDESLQAHSVDWHWDSWTSIVELVRSMPYRKLRDAVQSLAGYRVNARDVESVLWEIGPRG